MRFARYFTIGITSGASAWAALALLDSQLFWQLKLIIVMFGVAFLVGCMSCVASAWAESSVQRFGFMTPAEFEDFDARWAERGIDA